MLLLKDIFELGVTLLFEVWSLLPTIFPWAKVAQEGPRKEHQGSGERFRFPVVKDPWRGTG